MSEHKTLNTIIHAAFRRDLARFDEALSAFPAGSRNRANQLSAAWDNFVGQLHHHHQDEETIFFPALRALGADQSVVGDLDAEHAAMLTALGAASTSVKTLGAAPTAGNAQAARNAIADLGRIVRDHLAHEERDLEPFAASHLSTPQLKNAQTAVRKAHKRDAATFLAWLSDGADSDTAKALRRHIPPPVLFIATRIARRYNRYIATAWT